MRRVATAAVTSAPRRTEIDGGSAARACAATDELKETGSGKRPTRRWTNKWTRVNDDLWAGTVDRLRHIDRPPDDLLLAINVHQPYIRLASRLSLNACSHYSTSLNTFKRNFNNSPAIARKPREAVQISICKASAELHTEDIAFEGENSHFRRQHSHLT